MEVEEIQDKRLDGAEHEFVQEMMPDHVTAAPILSKSSPSSPASRSGRLNALRAIKGKTAEEKERLNALQAQFTRNLESITPNEYRKEMERLGIDLSWKSSQIEGNTYSLLETEKLLKEKQTASGKTKEEAAPARQF